MGTLGVRLLGEAVAAKFARKHAPARTPLARFVETAREAQWKDLVYLKQTFGSADYVNGWVIFDIGGNNYRLIAAVDFAEQLVVIDRVLTHAEYDRAVL